MNVISEGAEAKICQENIFGTDVIVKVRVKKEYRIPQLDFSIRRSRTRNEARIMRALKLAGLPIPRLIAVGNFSIYMEKLSGKLLKDFRFDASHISACGKLLARMHNIGIVHGDFTPANLLVNGNEVYIIDFGLSQFSKSIEDKAIDILLMKRSITAHKYKSFSKAYAENSNDSKAVFGRLAEIELRGRYQTRTLM
ncbi:MAG: KEOPS complex kinase/ATPase Bud32 [Candidatus Micrarchaeaceae archaeon]